MVIDKSITTQRPRKTVSIKGPQAQSQATMELLQQQESLNLVTSVSLQLLLKGRKKMDQHLNQSTSINLKSSLNLKKTKLLYQKPKKFTFRSKTRTTTQFMT